MFSASIVSLFIFLNASFAQWEALKIGVLYDSDQFSFPRKHLTELKDAILNLSLMIQVRPIPMEERQLLGHRDFAKCAPTVDFGHLWMFSASGQQIKDWTRPILNDSSVANFFIVLELNGNECLDDPTLLAGAKPCFYDAKQTNRPSMSRVVVCLNNQIWRQFQAGYDLFRHEILHALGFGMLHPQTEAKKAPKPGIVNWRTGPSNQQPIRNYYLDFGERAINFVRDHFNCLKMDAILADNHETFHLNEYLFGNELMTPILSDGRNLFTHLTGSILESTYVGNVSWYNVNKRLVEEESQQYWYGKNFGCEFVQRSCYEFIQSRLNLFDGAAFPFCTKNDMAKTLNGQKLNVCFSNKTHIYKAKTTCQIEYDLDDFGQKERYDLKPVSLNTQYRLLFEKWRQQVYGSTKDYRYCPMISQVFDGSFDNIPKNGVPVRCSN